MCGIAVEKAKGLGGIVIRTGDYAEAFINGSMKKVLWEISQNLQQKFCTRVSFSDKVRRCRSTTSFETETPVQWRTSQDDCCWL